MGWSAAPAGAHYRHVPKPDGSEYRVAVACAAHEYADGSMEFWAPGSLAFPTKVEALGQGRAWSSAHLPYGAICAALSDWL